MKIAAIVISCFVFLVFPQYGWAGDCSPLQISFIGDYYQLVPAEKDVCGLRLNLPIGVNENIYGLDLGFCGWGGEYKGVMLNLISTISVSDSAFDLPVKNGHSSTKGIQLAGLTNINIGNIDGIQIAGLFNTGYGVRGIQVAPVINFAASTMQGIQVAAANYSEKVTGLQCGLYNHAKSVRGIQIGLINVTQELSGLQIGLVNYIRESPVPILPIINLKF